MRQSVSVCVWRTLAFSSFEHHAVLVASDLCLLLIPLKLLLDIALRVLCLLVFALRLKSFFLWEGSLGKEFCAGMSGTWEIRQCNWVYVLLLCFFFSVAAPAVTVYGVFNNDGLGIITQFARVVTQVVAVGVRNRLS